MNISAVVFLCVLMTACIGTKVCNSGWKQLGNKCYYFSTNTLTWAQAVEVCEDEDSHLVRIDSKQEHEVLAAQAKSLGNRRFWIDGTDKCKEGVWIFKSTGKPIKYKDWSSGQPDNFGKNEHCMEINSKQKFNDAVCSAKLQYVCEKRQTRC